MSKPDRKVTLHENVSIFIEELGDQVKWTSEEKELMEELLHKEIDVLGRRTWLWKEFISWVELQN